MSGEGVVNTSDQGEKVEVKKDGKTNKKSKRGKRNKKPKSMAQKLGPGMRFGNGCIVGKNKIGSGASRVCYSIEDSKGNETEYVILYDNEENTKENKEILENVNKTESKFILRPEDFGKVGECNYEIYKKGVPLNSFKKKDLEGREIAVSFGIILGLKDLHKNGLAHSDIKIDNFIAVEEDGEPIVKLADFDKSFTYNGDKNKKVELGYDDYNAYSASPERISPSEGDNYFKSDIYSAFTVIYELFTGEAIKKATEEIIREKYFKGDKERTFGRIPVLNYRVEMGEELEEKLISRFIESIKMKKPENPVLRDERVIEMLDDIARCMFQHDHEKRHSLDEILEKFTEIIKYQVNEKGLDPLKDLKIPNEALKEVGLENLVGDKQKEQKNEKPANKIPNMNFTTVQECNKKQIECNKKQIENNLPIQSEENISSPEFDLGTNSKNNGMELKASGFDEVENLNNNKETKKPEDEKTEKEIEKSIKENNEELKKESEKLNNINNDFCPKQGLQRQ